MIPLYSVVNDEQLLEFALSHICEKDSNDVHPVATAILIRYAANNMDTDSWTEADIERKCSELIADYTLVKLVQKDLLEYEIKEDGNIMYKITDKGKQRIKK